MQFGKICKFYRSKKQCNKHLFYSHQNGYKNNLFLLSSIIFTSWTLLKVLLRFQSIETITHFSFLLYFYSNIEFLMSNNKRLIMFQVLRGNIIYQTTLSKSSKKSPRKVIIFFRSFYLSHQKRNNAVRVHSIGEKWRNFFL